MTIASSAGGMSGLISIGGIGGSLTCMSATVTGVSASNGTRPVSSSYRTTPTEYRSERASTGRPCACSGEMYCAVPMIEPVSVMSDVPARAIPKSVTRTRPSWSISTLCGLMSRCTIPRLWA